MKCLYLNALGLRILSLNIAYCKLMELMLPMDDYLMSIGISNFPYIEHCNDSPDSFD